jgi:hypothetical protein
MLRIFGVLSTEDCFVHSIILVVPLFMHSFYCLLKSHELQVAIP